MIQENTSTLLKSSYKLKNKNGMEVEFIDFGARLKSIIVPDKNGNFDDILLGYSNNSDYFNNDPYIGAICGRVANRISNASFVLNGKKFQLIKNDGNNHLHGGIKGFHNRYWKVYDCNNELVQNKGYTLKLLCCDGEDGYPGNLEVKIEYILTDLNELIINYLAYTDEPTLVNLTSHGYFNLKGEGNGNILDHNLQVNADYYTPINEEVLPTGELNHVNYTGFDLRKPKKIIDIIYGLDTPFFQTRGIDHNWVIKNGNEKPALAAILSEDTSGRVMEIYSTQPGLQIYTANSFNGQYIGKSGKSHEKHSGIALESQFFPDSPNISKFPSIVLNPGEIYQHQTIYKFYVHDKK